mgnify:CR=1 FL=1
MEKNTNKKDSKDIKLINENHFLSLRKNMKNKAIYTKNNYLIKENERNKNIIEINFDAKNFESKIESEKLFNLFSTCEDKISKLGYCLQMIITNDDNLIVYGLYQINIFLLKYTKELFETENLIIQFNESMFKYLFDILDKKYNDDDYNILLLLTSIINKLCQFSNQYIVWLTNNLSKIYNILVGISNPINKNKNKSKNNHIKNSLFIIINNIFILDDFSNYKDNFENNYKELFPIILNEIYDIKNSDSFLFYKKYMSTLITFISNIFMNRLYISYIFKNTEKIKRKDRNIFDAIKFILKYQSTYDLINSSILCLYNFIEFYMDIKDTLSEDEQEDVNFRICDMNIHKFIVPLVYDNKDNIINNDFKIYVFKILINTIYNGDYEYWTNLIEKGLSSQINKLQNFLMEVNVDKNSNTVFEYHLLLILNLVSTENEEVINDIAIKYPCISNLFKFFNSNNHYIKKHLNLFLNTIHYLIKNKCKYKKRQYNFPYIKTLLISEGICQFYKNLLLDENSLNQDLIQNIFIDILTLIEFYGNFEDNKNNNIILLHFQIIGMNDIIENYKSKINLSNELMNIISDVSDKLIKEV